MMGRVSNWPATDTDTGFCIVFDVLMIEILNKYDKTRFKNKWPTQALILPLFEGGG